MGKKQERSDTEVDASAKLAKDMQEGGAPQVDAQGEGKKRSDVTLSRRLLIAIAGSTGLTALAGCSEIFEMSNEEDQTPQTDTSNPTPEVDSETEPDTQTDSEEIVPEDFDDGCGDAGPGAAVGGTQDEMEFEISPVNSQSQSADQEHIETRNQAYTPLSLKKREQGTGSVTELSSDQTQTLNQSSSTCEMETIQIMEQSRRALNLNHAASQIYPGSLLNVDSVWRGQMKPINVERAPIRLSVSLVGTQFDGSSSRVVPNPRLSTVRDAINDLLRSVNTGTATPAQMSYAMDSIRTHEESHVKLGVHFNGLGRRFGFDFDSERQLQQSKVLVKFRQRYFTVDVDIPNAFFADGGTPSDEDAIVSSVTYGRLLLFSATSSHSEQELKASLEAVFGNIGGSLNSKQEEVLNESNIRVTALGGSGDAAADVITNGLQGIESYIQEGADYSPDSPGYPLSYGLTYLSDFSTANLAIGTEYERKACNEYTFMVRDISFTGIETYDGFLNDEIELYGTITIQAIGFSAKNDVTTQIETEERSNQTSNPSNRTSTPTTSPTKDSSSKDNNHKFLWHIPEGDNEMIFLSEGETISIGDREFVVPIPNSDPPQSARLRIVTELYEYEPHTDDEYRIGSETEDIPLSEIDDNTEASEVTMELSRDGSVVNVEMDLESIT